LCLSLPNGHPLKPPSASLRALPSSAPFARRSTRVGSRKLLALSLRFRATHSRDHLRLPARTRCRATSGFRFQVSACQHFSVSAFSVSAPLNSHPSTLSSARPPSGLKFQVSGFRFRPRVSAPRFASCKSDFFEQEKYRDRSESPKHPANRRIAARSRAVCSSLHAAIRCAQLRISVV
jgi:hypothetical protein